LETTNDNSGRPETQDFLIMDKVYDYEGLRLLNKIKELLELEEELDIEIF
tara:strand:- start:101 stop:250 length:150 start_codon:yes stop_codon:yes gene_type:complete